MNLEGNPDFEFEHGAWTVELSRLTAPLSGGTDWVDYSGTSIVRPVWRGLANLGELDVSGPAGSIQGLSLRLWHPETNQWRIHWANSRDGDLGEPMVGGFHDGIGEFHNREAFGDRTIDVRFLFTEITESTFRLEQAFSPDDGATWETNWIARFRRS